MRGIEEHKSSEKVFYDHYVTGELKDSIIDAIKSNSSIVIIGKPGSGKVTLLNSIMQEHSLIYGANVVAMTSIVDEDDIDLAVAIVGSGRTLYATVLEDELSSDMEVELFKALKTVNALLIDARHTPEGVRTFTVRH